jgi:hypothetical protein
MDEPHDYMGKWRELRDKFLREQKQHEAMLEDALRQQIERDTFVPHQPRRVRQVWREEDDYLFNAGYRAWLATDHP